MRARDEHGEVRLMRVILQAGDEGDSLLLQARAAQYALKEGRPKVGDFISLVYDDGSEFVVKWNKESVSVWPQSLPVRSA